MAIDGSSCTDQKPASSCTNTAAVMTGLQDAMVPLRRGSNQEIISLPEPLPTRLELSIHDHTFDPHMLVAVARRNGAINVTEKQQTVLYLAYGSNLVSRIFQGRRGIRPLAAINVVVPELEMTFDLPGIPYSEPCFSNSKYRHVPALKPKGPTVACHEHPHPPYKNPSWLKGMVGVVYEVTLSDYAHIIATEGGGVAYQDVLVTCYPLPASTSTVPQHPTTLPFKAHTLYSPSLQALSRCDADYAQPSLRYLNLLRDGADEHGLPQDYKAYLQELEPYTITSQRQAFGAFVITMLWRPFLLLVFALTARYANDTGQSPTWLKQLMAGIFKAVWRSYDDFFYDLFGDGERTQKQGRDADEEEGTAESENILRTRSFSRP